MSINTAIEIMIDYNNWRRDTRDVSVYKMPDPTQIGIAIETVIKHHRNEAIN